MPTIRQKFRGIPFSFILILGLAIVTSGCVTVDCCLNRPTVATVNGSGNSARV